jgi:urease accessory protein
MTGVTYSRGMVFFATCLSAVPAYGHNLGGKYGPLLHPLISLEHVLALLGVGLLVGQQGAPMTRLAIAALLLGLLLGAALPMLVSIPGNPMPYLDAMNMTSLLVLGGLVALAARLPRLVVLTLLMLFGLTHGSANAIDLLGTAAPVLIVVGVTLAGCIVTTPLAAITLSLQQEWPRVAVRVAGSWIAAIGLMMFGWQLKQLF